jgi:hypothetical protein
VHLGLDAGNQHLVVQRPQADGFVFVQRGAGGLEVGQLVSPSSFSGKCWRS